MCLSFPFNRNDKSAALTHAILERRFRNATIDAHLKHAAGVQHLYPIDRAVHRRTRHDAAWNSRDATWSMVIVSVHPDPTKAPVLRKWAWDYWAVVHRTISTAPTDLSPFFHPVIGR